MKGKGKRKRGIQRVKEGERNREKETGKKEEQEV